MDNVDKIIKRILIVIVCILLLPFVLVIAMAKRAR